MIYLKIENGKGYYLDKQGSYQEIDKIGKEDILDLLEILTTENEFEMDEYKDEKIKNEAHKIIYYHLYQKLSDLLLNRNRFIDESNAYYKDAIKKYRTDKEEIVE